MSNARQEILAKLKKTKNPIPNKPDFTEPVFHEVKEPLEIAFKESLEQVNGEVHIFHSEQQLFENLGRFLKEYSKEDMKCREPEILKLLQKYGIRANESEQLGDKLEVGITGCEFLIAHTGSAMVSSAQKGGRQLFVYPEIHVVVAKKNQLVAYLEDAYLQIIAKYGKNLPSQITLITGPSRTADIEKTLTLGAHGPKELHVFLH